MASHGGLRARFWVCRAGVASLGAEEAALPAVTFVTEAAAEAAARLFSAEGR